ncbi:hypothetical protein [Actinomadura violacea]|uniref:Uncharacterized protein n=1 Tax=Actinomadura violacea TaxID=2819934 RepID=A0ABS3RSW4_9ACTN|nr:hypothetical protein [Actinomadura violacea]MBO2459847.1 hypothetical protein [Actinomadura violacea]
MTPAISASAAPRLLVWATGVIDHAISTHPAWKIARVFSGGYRAWRGDAVITAPCLATLHERLCAHDCAELDRWHAEREQLLVRRYVLGAVPEDRSSSSAPAGSASGGTYPPRGHAGPSEPTAAGWRST